MSWGLNEEQHQLRDSLRRMLEATYGFEQRRSIGASEIGWSRSGWVNLSDLGVTALGVGEAEGGLGGSAVDIGVVMAELGRSLALEPFLASAVLVAAALRFFGLQKEVAPLLKGIAEGRTLMAWAHDEAAVRHDFARVETEAKLVGGRWLLTGAKVNVLHATSADCWVVSARLPRDHTERADIALFLVDPGAIGASMRAYRLVDETPAGELRFDATPAIALGDPFDQRLQGAALTGVRAAGIAALCSEAVGVMDAAFELTCRYANTRLQFGRALGANQAYRHQIAEMAVALESCRSAAMLAAKSADRIAENAPEDDRDLSRAKALIGLYGRQVCHQAIQLHGGIGMTEEYKVGHCLRRMFVIDQLLGDSDTHIDKLGSQIACATLSYGIGVNQGGGKNGAVN